MGNPHAVPWWTTWRWRPCRQGPLIERHPAFPRRVNAGFMQVVDRAHVRLRVFERGAGETLACGTGACAAVVAGIRLGLLDARRRGPRGLLTIEWAGGHATRCADRPRRDRVRRQIELPDEQLTRPRGPHRHASPRTSPNS
jgi:diaminopimelate epimerase